ncbi:tetratricopeptide repeat protein [Oceanicola sp. S124]|uniref:tetratricopeptide repeat protein n=1 Tax=Oceanicola sp. S124 TaxID=1042378 RepID=UPI000255A9FC|nr:tetratricopeptide repeat protein [Oceanicola sp. S124]
MSETDSFIDEVNDEVRRDRLYGLLRRYGWIAVLVVLAIVGGAAWNEFQKARERAASEAFGDAILDALDEADSDARIAALEAVPTSTPGQAALAAFLASSEAAAGADDPARAAAALDGQQFDGIYGDIATFKKLILEAGVTPAAERRDGFRALAAPGNPLRLLAEEQIALTHVEEGATDEALQVLQSILADAEVTQGLRQRASQLIVALGGEPGSGA